MNIQQRKFWIWDFNCFCIKLESRHGQKKRNFKKVKKEEKLIVMFLIPPLMDEHLDSADICSARLALSPWSGSSPSSRCSSPREALPFLSSTSNSTLSLSAASVATSYVPWSTGWGSFLGNAKNGGATRRFKAPNIRNPTHQAPTHWESVDVRASFTKLGVIKSTYTSINTAPHPKPRTGPSVAAAYTKAENIEHHIVTIIISQL